jgi:hypothetical protein
VRRGGGGVLVPKYPKDGHLPPIFLPFLYSNQKPEINVKSFNYLILFGIFFGKEAKKFNPLSFKKFVTLQDQLGGN